MSLIKQMKIKSIPLHKIILGLTLLYFLVFGVLMAYTAGQPDQSAHQYYSQKFSETWGIPEEDISAGHRFFTGRPYLYYWINGAIAKIYRGIFPNNPPIRVVMLWRVISAVISTFTVYYCYKTASKVAENPYAGLLAAFFLSNTLMFVFISGGNSYDNLMNLAAMAAIYHLVSVYKGNNFVKHTALTGMWVVIGALSKEQFLLLTLIIFLAWLFFVIRNFRNIKIKITKKNVVFGLVFLIFLGLFLGLYGVNFIRYSRTTPLCSQIKPPENCSTYTYRRDFYEPISIRVLWERRDIVQNPIQYAFQYWIFKMAESIWGILSHNTFVPMFAVGLHTVLTLWGFICLFRYWKPQDKVNTLLLFVLFSYCGYVFMWNYKTDLEFSFQHYGVTGRYLMPILGVLLTLMTYNFLKIRNTLIKRLTITLSIMLYFSSGLWMFLSRYAEKFSHWHIYE